MPSSLSLPSGSRTFVARASIVNTSLSNRLATTAHLDRYMKVLKDKCPVHFGNGGRLVSAANHMCTMESALPMDFYGPFKLGFSFERFTYCFQCCLPQSRNRNGEEPACHAGFSYRKGEKCPFAGIMFKSVFCMWHNPGFRELLIKEMGAGASLENYDHFLTWIIKDSTDGGRYNNLVETFIWFCSALEKADSKFFY